MAWLLTGSATWPTSWATLVRSLGSRQRACVRRRRSSGRGGVLAGEPGVRLDDPEHLLPAPVGGDDALGLAGVADLDERLDGGVGDGHLARRPPGPRWRSSRERVAVARGSAPRADGPEARRPEEVLHVVAEEEPVEDGLELLPVRELVARAEERDERAWLRGARRCGRCARSSRRGGSSGWREFALNTSSTKAKCGLGQLARP